MGCTAALPLCRAPALMGINRIRQPLRVSRRHLLFDLQEHGILRAVPFEQHHVIAQPDASGSHYLEAHVDRTEQIEQVPPVRRKNFAIGRERIQHRTCSLAAELASTRGAGSGSARGLEDRAR